MSKNIPVFAALVVAAGSGERFGGEIPKQYQSFMGKPVLCWSLDAFRNHPLVSNVAVVVHPDHIDRFKRTVPDIEPVSGGNTRQSSVRLGLESLRTAKPDFVLIHDAARPLVSENLITALCDAAVKSGAAIPGLPVTDSVKRNGKTESRDNLYTVQTPQAFHFTTIDNLHQEYRQHSFTDDSALYEAGSQPVVIVPGQRDNIKITHPSDLHLAEQCLYAQRSDIRTAQGYDVHRFVPPETPARKLMLCGIAVPHDKVLEGHSDADVGLHAVTDAVLGTLCDGDIGLHFSPKDARWKNADSSLFLKHAAERVAQKGGILAHVDVTLVCESPKIAPFREAMRQRISDILSIPLSRVSVKATTTEGLGFTGRGEGIAAQSIVTARFPFGESLETWD